MSTGVLSRVDARSALGGTLREAEPRGRDGATAGLVALLVATLCQLPALVNPSFYFWDDSAAQFLPMWHKLGERFLAGDWPPLLDADSWMGGNLAAESLFGIWNPVHLLDYLLVVWIGDLALAATVVKTQFLAVLGVGVFFLCREYGAGRGPASVLGVALPLSGFVLYFQAATWAGGLMGFAWLPWAWWSLRRMARGGAPLVPFAICYLCVSAGDPYGVLALCFVFLGLFIESCTRGRRGAVRSLVLIGTATALVLPLIFMPLVATSGVSWRSGLALFNVGQLVPDLADLLNLSMPSFVPQILSFGSFRMTVPALYFAWFVVPLVAWLDWKPLVTSWRKYAAALTLAVCYVLLCLGPSNVWLFRWPLRHLAILHLALSVLVAVVLTRGLRTDRFRLRLACTAGALVFCAYLSFSAWPSKSLHHLVSLALLCGLLAFVLAVRRKMVSGVLHLGTVCALVLQVFWFPANQDVAVYNFPTDVEKLRAEFAGLRGGTVAQIADRAPVAPDDIASRDVWRHLLFGNMYAAAGVSSMVAYTGIGYDALHKRLCMSHYGSVCPRAYRSLWSADEVGVPLADQLKLDHVVVQRTLIDQPTPPPGWRITERNRHVTVLGRTTPSRWKRVSVARGLTVTSDVEPSSREEKVGFVRHPQAPGELVFARLAWPGYQATVDGRPVTVCSTSAGLIRVAVPPGTHTGTLTLTWSPPGFGVHVALAVAGTLLALALFVVHTCQRRGQRC